MPLHSKWEATWRKGAPYALAVLRIVTAFLFAQHATMKFFDFPSPLPGMSGPLPTIMLVAGGSKS